MFDSWESLEDRTHSRISMRIIGLYGQKTMDSCNTMFHSPSISDKFHFCTASHRLRDEDSIPKVPPLTEQFSKHVWCVAAETIYQHARTYAFMYLSEIGETLCKSIDLSRTRFRGVLPFVFTILCLGRDIAAETVPSISFRWKFIPEYIRMNGRRIVLSKEGTRRTSVFLSIFALIELTARS